MTSNNTPSRSALRILLATGLAACLAGPLRAGGDGPSLVWSQASGTEGWLPRAVAIGNYGTQVFSQVGPFLDYTRLLSAHDTHPPTPVWTEADTNWTYEHRADSADEAPVHVAIHKSFVSGGSGPKRPIVQKFTSSSSNPDWEYTFPIDHYGTEPIDVAASRNGQVIVAAVFDPPTADTRVAVFGPGSSVPQSYTLVNTSGSHSRMLLSADGSTLYLWSNSWLTLVDVPSGQTIWSTVVFDGPIRNGHALSSDGRTFAFGAANDIRIYRRSGSSNYVLAYEHVLPTAYRADALAISTDGTILACGANHADGLTIRALCLDLASFQVSMSYQTSGAGTLTNLVADIGVAPNGSRFAVGSWGDEGGLVPEVLFFDSRENAPIGSHSLPGSALSVDFAADNEHVVVASKEVHANTFGGGGRISLFRTSAADFRMIGVPESGRTVDFDLHAAGPVPSVGILLLSHSPAPTPEPFPGVGTLYLNRQDLTFYSMGAIGSDGVATRTYQIPANALPGSNLYFQGLVTGPRRLSEDWVRMTVLP